MLSKLRKKGITFVVHQAGTYQLDPKQHIHLADIHEEN